MLRKILIPSLKWAHVFNGSGVIIIICRALAARIGCPEEQVLMLSTGNLPADLDETVNQFAADYYELPSSSSAAVDFTGAPVVSLLGSAAPSGQYFWYAQRANTSNPRLTRTVDLRDVEESAIRQVRHILDRQDPADDALVSMD